MKRRGKVIAWSSVGLGLAVLAGVAWTSYDFILEIRYIPRLDSGVTTEAVRAAENLAEIGSVRAVPHMFEALKKVRVREVALDKSTRPVHQRAFELALMRITTARGRATVPYLIRALQDDDWYIRQLAASLLGELGAQAEAAVPALKDALKDPSEPVRWRVKRALSNTEEPVKIYRHDRERASRSTR